MIAAVCLAQVAREANEAYRDGSTRQKVAAGMMGPARDERQKPKELIAALGIKPGMAVADVGAGSGYMLPHLAEAVGPSGKVFAEDIFPDLVEAARKSGAKYSNITYIQGNAESAELPPNSVDLVLVLDAYHHFDHPETMLASLKRALKPGGRIAIVEYHKNEKSMPGGRALTHIRATLDEFVKEIEGFGYRAKSVREFLPDVQWLGIFEPL
jgi:ubiquinone/menaquinone biosynthesis C-methylase UbiE